VIRFLCSCGKRLKADVSEISRTVECPNCAAKLVVPDPDAPPAEEAFTSAPEALAAAMRELAPTAARPSKVAVKRAPPAPRRRPLKPGLAPARGASSAKKAVIIAVAAGAFAIISLLVVLAFFLGGGDGNKHNVPAGKEAPPAIQAPAPPQPETKPERNHHPPGDLFPKVAPAN